MEGENGVTRSIIDELHSWYIEGDEMEGESGVTRSIIDVIHSLEIEEYSLMNFILLLSNEIKWKVKVVLLEL